MRRLSPKEKPRRCGASSFLCQLNTIDLSYGAGLIALVAGRRVVGAARLATRLVLHVAALLTIVVGRGVARVAALPRRALVGGRIRGCVVALVGGRVVALRVSTRRALVGRRPLVVLHVAALRTALRATLTGGRRTTHAADVHIELRD